MKLLLSISLSVLLLVAASTANAAPATRIYVGAFLHDVTAFDQRSGTYEVDMDVWAKWLGDFDASSVRLQNAAGDITEEDLGESADGEWHAHRWRVRGTLRSEFPLQRFPFDVQQLVVVFELPTLRGDLVPDLAGSGMAPRFSITGWEYDPHFTPKLSDIVYTSDLGTFENEGGSTKARRVAFGVTLHRPAAPTAVKLFLPLALLILISLVSLFLGPDLVDPRTAIGITVLLACFAFQFTVAGTIPDVAYLTIVDSLFILAYALAAATLVESIAVYWVHQHGREALALRIDRIFRVLIPVIAISVSAYVVRPEAASADLEERVATEHRPRSERDVVRVGVLSLPSAMSAPLRSATRYGLVRMDAQGERHPGLADSVPSVTNDMLTFGADGSLTVHWHLREGTKWSDGHALTSDDFRFALEVSPDPHVRAVETPDDRTLVLTYDDVLAAALEGLAPMPRHALGETLRSGGFAAVRDARRTRPLPSVGPYHVTNFVADERATAVANPHFVDAPPSIAKLEVLRFEDMDALSAALREGRIDLIVPNALSPEAADALATAMPGSTLERASSDLLALIPDLHVPLLRELSVRRVLLQAIDRTSVAHDAYGELGYVALSPVPGIPPNPNDAQPFDAAAARAELEASHLVGSELTLVHSPRPMEKQVAESIASHLRAAGLVVTLREQAPGTGGFGAPSGGLRLALIRSDDDSDPRRYWNLERRDGRFVDSARTSAYDEEAADLVFRFHHALYPERRAQLRDRSASGVAEKLPLLPLLFAPEIAASNPELRGWREGEDFGDTIADWHFAAENSAE